MRVVKGETFAGTVEVDGKHFTACRFIGCEFVFHGIEAWSYDACDFEGVPTFRFEGNARMIAYVIAALIGSKAFSEATYRTLNALLDDRPIAH